MFLNAIPVIGHVKGVVHYVTGDKERGRRAICEATRTTVVIGGGVVGAVAGPAGAAFVAAAGGVLLDSVASIATKEPMGLCSNINNIVADVRNGKPPLAAALEAGITVGADLLTGVTAGALTSGSTKAVGKSTGKKITKTIGKVLKKTLCKKSLKKEIGRKALTVGAAVAEAAVKHIQSPKYGNTDSSLASSSCDCSNQTSSRTSLNIRRLVSSDDENDSKKDNFKRASPKNTSGHNLRRSSSVNKGKIKKRCSLKMTKSYETFRKTISEESFRDICIEGDYIFRDLGSEEQRSFSTRVRNLKRQGYDAGRLIEVTTELFKNLHSPGEEVNHRNYLLEMDFVATYVGEQVARLNDLCNENTEVFKEIDVNRLSTKERLRQLADTITTNLLSPRDVPLLKDVTIDYLVCTFRTIKSQVTEIVLQPNFENVYSAVCYYYINRYLPEQNREISVWEYFDIVKFLLSDIAEAEDYELLREGDIPVMHIEIQADVVGKAEIVLRNESGKVIISSISFSQ